MIWNLKVLVPFFKHLGSRAVVLSNCICQAGNSPMVVLWQGIYGMEGQGCLSNAVVL